MIIRQVGSSKLISKLKLICKICIYKDQVVKTQHRGGRSNIDDSICVGLHQAYQSRKILLAASKTLLGFLGHVPHPVPRTPLMLRSPIVLVCYHMLRHMCFPINTMLYI